MIKKYVRLCLFLLLLLCLSQVLLAYLRQRSQVSGLTMVTNETEEFRRQHLSEKLVGQLVEE